VKSLVIKGLPPYDGEYPLDFGDGFSLGEGHKIKEIFGLTAGELAPAVERGDSDLLGVFAWVLLTRAGHTVDMNVLWDAPQSAFDMVGEDDPTEDDDRPPASATTGGDSNRTAVVANQSSEPGPSGPDGDTGGADSQPDPNPIGSPG